MAQDRFITRQTFMKQISAIAGCLALVVNSGVSAEPSEARTAGSGDRVSIVTRATGLAEPLFGKYRVSRQHEIKPGNAFYPSIANLDGTLYVVQGSGDSLFIQTFDPKTLTPSEATEVWSTKEDTGHKTFTYPPGVNDIRAFDGTWSVRIEISVSDSGSNPPNTE